MAQPEDTERREAVRNWRSLLTRGRSRPPADHRSDDHAEPRPPSSTTRVQEPRPQVAPRPRPAAAPHDQWPAGPPAPATARPPVPGPRPGRPPRVAQVPDRTQNYVATLRRSVGRPRSIAFVNPKGGVHKTTATVLAAATLGTARGGGVLAWDDNELRGTLGLRAGTARHARTVRHLIEDLVTVETAPQLRQVLENYVRHSADGTFDVLAGDEDPRVARHLDPSTVRRLLTVLSHAYDLICVDTGNNVESPNWQTVIRTADRMVVTTLPREDAAFTADWMLDLLEADGHEALVADAVVVLSCPTPRPAPLLDELVEHFGQRCRAVAVIPYDPVLEIGSTIAFSEVSAETKTAWLRAAAAIVDGWAPPARPAPGLR